SFIVFMVYYKKDRDTDKNDTNRCYANFSFFHNLHFPLMKAFIAVTAAMRYFPVKLNHFY
ncbi:MAG: hypothetical protein K2O03_00315, partial [Lachnospiraceae bacterium]|nr:hypothetical protein [Lachnospiraceae bacterium]